MLIVDYNGIKTEYVYNNYGNVVKETKTAGNKSISYDYAYSNNGNFLTKTHDGRGTSNFDSYTTKYNYNSYSMLSKITEPLNKITNFTYDSENNLKKMTSHGATNQYSYTRGLLTKILCDTTEENGGNVFTFEYDGFGTLIATYLNGTKVREIKYELNGTYQGNDESTFNYVMEINVRNTLSASAEKKIFAKDGSLIKVISGTYYQGTFTPRKTLLQLTYDQRGRIATVTDNSTSTPQTYNYTYKADGTTQKITKGGFADIEISEYELEEYVNLIKFSKYNSASGNYIHEYLKVNDRIKSLTTPNEKTTEYTYDEFNRIKSKETLFPDGLVEPDVLGVNFEYTKDFLTSMEYNSLDDTIKEYYNYDQRGNISGYSREKVDSDNISLEVLQIVNYQYDNLNRLTREDNLKLNFSKVYTYDVNGNIVSIAKYPYTVGSIYTNPIETLNMAYGQDGIDKNSYTMSCYGEPYSGSEQIVSTSGAYDFNGNPLLFEDIMLEWNKGCMIGHGNTALEYDINGIRQKKYFYDNDRVHVYYTENDRIHKEVISENGATTKTLKYFYDESGICGMSYNEQNYFFHKNAFGDVVRIYGSDALLVAEYVYDAWGNHKIYAPNGQEITDATHIANLNPFRYRGYYYDTDMQLYYLNSRYYSPRACRFVSADDIDVATDNYLSTLNGLNLYTYCLNNPIMYTDPSGHLAEWLWKLIIGTSFILIGALVTAATAGAMTSFWAVFGSALLSSAMQVGTSVAIGVAVNGIVNLSNGNNFFDNIGDTIASSYMWGGILSGASQLLSGGFRFLRAKTGFKGLNTAKVGLLSADGLHFKKAGMTIFRFGRRKGAKLAFDFGRYGIHAHIFSDLHIPMIPFIVGLFEAL